MKVTLVFSKDQTPRYLAYYATLLLLAAASLFPGQRLWGVNHWAYLPPAMFWILLLLGAVAPLVLGVFLRPEPKNEVGEVAPAADSRTYGIVAIGMMVLLGAAFYVFRTTTHFQGDGYSALSNLSSAVPFIKPTDLGEALVHLWLKNLIGEGAEAALASYQIVSVGAGLLFVLTALFVSKWLWDTTRDRILFVLGLLSGGYLLLFFGYAENYSLLTLGVALFTLLGVLIARRKAGRFWILLPLGLTVWFHVSAIALIPAAVYLLTSDTRLGELLAQSNKWIKAGLAVALAGALGLLFLHYYTSRYVVHFTFLPLWVDRFTVGGYTLFSVRHLVDMLNELMLLMPGLAVMGIACRTLPMGSLLQSRQNRFLVVLVASTWGAVFVLDPRLAMPRDWDLCSLGGIPLSVLAYTLVLDNRSRIRGYVLPTALAVALGFLALSSRVATQTNAEAATAQVKDYQTLDPLRTRRVLNALVLYYGNISDSTGLQSELDSWGTRFPEWEINRRGLKLMGAGNPGEAVPLFRQVIEINPGYSEGYSNLGSSFLYTKEYDSAVAYYRIATGLNPYWAPIYSNLGAAYYYLGDLKSAEEVLQKSVSLDSSSAAPLVYLTMLYRETNRRDQYVECMEKAASKNGVPPELLLELAQHYAAVGERRKAAAVLKTAIERGVDPAAIEKLRQSYENQK